MSEFKELFCYVRLMFVLCDYLFGFIVINFFVKEDVECLDCVMQVLRWFDGKLDGDFLW